MAIPVLNLLPEISVSGAPGYVCHPVDAHPKRASEFGSHISDELSVFTEHDSHSYDYSSAGSGVFQWVPQLF